MASAGVVGAKEVPASSIVPPPEGWMPLTIFTRVDLPAPLAPISTVTWPGCKSRSTPLSTRLGPNDFIKPLTTKTGVPCNFSSRTVTLRTMPSNVNWIDNCQSGS